MASKLVMVVAAVLVLSVAGRPVCHNITGTCTKRGFECVSGEVVTHAQRCDGVEDCSDGSDELLCGHEDHRPLHERTAEERQAVLQGTCVNCNCAATAYDITSSSNWFQFARVAPTDLSLMTGSTYSGQPCSSVCTTTITVGFYRKNLVCRGYLCCARQRACVACTTSPAGCTTASSGTRCY